VKVAEVNADGTVTGLSAGTTKINVSGSGKTASAVVTVNAELKPVNRYMINPVVNNFRAAGNSINDLIKYSVSYGEYDFYYIHLGEMQNIPLFSYETYYHTGLNSSYTIAVEHITKNSVQNTVSDSRQTALNYVDSYTHSTETDHKIKEEISARYRGLTVKVEAKVAGEHHWNTITTNSTENNTQLTTSLTDTQTHGTEYTERTLKSRTWSMDQNYKTGYYRYSLFSTSDVYLYVIKDRSKPKEIYYEFREHVKPNVYFWTLDYSDNPSFKKSDESRFGFDVSMLDELDEPKFKPSTDITPHYKVTFDSNGGSAVSGQSVIFNGRATRPDVPTRNDGYTFVDWYSNSGLTTLYDFSTPVTQNITLYAKWTPGGNEWGDTLEKKLAWLQIYAVTGG
jgi:uncharacterized repeat protein (TIGR02543 family)